jgi:metal-responsive CopG/Arc/MetJ family transcriptional regulator
MKTIAITIDDDTLKDLDRLIASGSPAGTARSRSRMIRDAVREYIRTRERAAAEAHEAAVIRRHRTRLMKQSRAAIREQAKP